MFLHAKHSLNDRINSILLKFHSRHIFPLIAAASLLPAIQTQAGSPVHVQDLMSQDSDPFDGFGKYVDVDGDTAIISADGTSESGVGAGAAFIFVRDGGGTWSQQAKLLASDGSFNDRFGFAVAIDGDVAVVGAFHDDDACPGSTLCNSGSAYVFARDGQGVWTEQQKLTASDAAGGDEFGFNVAISGDTILVGAPERDEFGEASGAVYVFTQNTSGTWVETGKLEIQDPLESDRIGTRIELEEGLAFVQARRSQDPIVDNGGAVYVFRYEGESSWVFETRLLASDSMFNDVFGSSISYRDGIAAFGAIGVDGRFGSAGAAYVFERVSPGNWNELDKLSASDSAFGDGGFGMSIAASDGRVIVGAYTDNNENGNDAGAVYVYERTSPTKWTEVAKILTHDGVEDDLFGHSLGVVDNYLIVGQQVREMNGMQTGTVYAYRLCPADINNSGQVNGSDLAILLAQWGGIGPADLNFDGVVNGVDLAALLSAWGP